MRRQRGIAHVPEDHRMGMIMSNMAWENTFFGYQDDPAFEGKFGWMNRQAIVDDAKQKMERFDIRPPNPNLKAENFSGGNQQKIVLAREIERNPSTNKSSPCATQARPSFWSPWNSMKY